MLWRVKGYYLREINYDGIVEADDEEEADSKAEARDFVSVTEEEGDDSEFSPDTAEPVGIEEKDA